MLQLRTLLRLLIVGLFVLTAIGWVFIEQYERARIDTIAGREHAKLGMVNLAWKEVLAHRTEAAQSLIRRLDEIPFTISEVLAPEARYSLAPASAVLVDWLSTYPDFAEVSIVDLAGIEQMSARYNDGSVVLAPPEALRDVSANQAVQSVVRKPGQMFVGRATMLDLDGKPSPYGPLNHVVRTLSDPKGRVIGLLVISTRFRDTVDRTVTQTSNPPLNFTYAINADGGFIEGDQTFGALEFGWERGVDNSNLAELKPGLWAAIKAQQHKGQWKDESGLYLFAPFGDLQAVRNDRRDEFSTVIIHVPEESLFRSSAIRSPVGITLIVLLYAMYMGVIRLVWGYRRVHAQMEQNNAELRDTATRLEARTREAEHAKAVQQRFLSTMTHELRTPLNAVLGFGQLIEKSGQLKGEPAEQIRFLNTAGHSLMATINDILDVSKIESGKLQLEAEPFRLYDVVGDVISVLTVNAKAKSLELVLEPLPSEAPDFLVGDAIRIKQMLFNLVGNALKFTEQGMVTVRMVLKDIDDDGRARLRFEIKDTGPGIAEADIGRLFNRFQQLEDGNKRHFGGTGLGLVIVKELAEAMNGSVDVASTPGEGSTFAFEIALPVASEGQFIRNQRARNISSLPGPEYYRLDGIRVLLVDDSAMNLRVATKILEREGAAQIATAVNGREAMVWLYEAHNVADVILMDVQMPEMDGIEATTEIRQDPRFNRVPVIGLSAGVEHHDEAINAGMQGFLNKPLNPDEVLLTIREQVALARGEPLGPGRLREDRDVASTGEEADLSAELAPLATLAGIDVVAVEAKMGRSRDQFIRNLDHMLKAYSRYADPVPPPVGNYARESMRASMEALGASARFVGAVQLERATIAAAECLRRGDDDEHLAEALKQVALTLQSLRDALDQSASS